MGTKRMTLADDKIVAAIKKDIVDGDTTETIERSYQVLDDGTLVVHIWDSRTISPSVTYRLNLSLGRIMKPSEWKNNVGN